MASTILVTLSVAFIFCVSKALIRGISGPLRTVPGPWYTPFTNLPLKWATIAGRRVYFVDSLHRKYGDIVRIAPNEVCFRDPAAVKEIHRPASGFRKDKFYAKFVDDDVEDKVNMQSFCMIENKPHAARRRLMARAFSKSEVRRHWEGYIRNTVSYAVEKMKGDADAHAGEVDVMKWWMLMAADVSSKISFGESFNMLDLGELNAYMRAVQRISKLGGIAAELSFFKYVLGALRFVPIPSVQEVFNSRQTIMEISARAIDNSKSSSKSTSIFNGMLAESEKVENSLPRLALLREARGLIIAGSDTTAITLTFLIWSVLSRPQLHKQLLEELQAKLPNNFADEDLEELPLINAIIQETLRLYGAAPGTLPRNPPPGGATLGGVYLSEDTIVSTQAWSLHRNPEIWKSPEEFDVTRWLPGAEMTDAMRSSFSPFGLGARMCLGIHIAEMELRMGTATFFRSYPLARLARSTTDESMAPVNYFVIKPKMNHCKVLLE